MTNYDESRIRNKSLLYPDLSYKIQGAIFAVANSYGVGLKEIIYEKALIEEFEKRKIKFESQKRINIYSIESGKVLGTYVPDFVVEDKIILEIKATSFTIQDNLRQQQSYLKASQYEVAYLVNFGTAELYLKRSIFTNDHKPFLAKIRAS